MAKKKKTCYVICPIGAPDSDIRKRSDKIFKYIIQPAVEQSGYETPLRSDRDVESDMITSAIFQHIIDDTLVIADLTGPNANVFYELGVRHSFQKPVIHLLEKGESPPFDAYDIRAIEVSTDIEVATAAVDEIKARIKALEEGADVNSPVRVAATLALAGSAGGGADNQIDYQIFEELLQLSLSTRQDMAEVKRLVSRPKGPGYFIQGQPVQLPWKDFSSWGAYGGGGYVVGSGRVEGIGGPPQPKAPPRAPQPKAPPDRAEPMNG